MRKIKTVYGIITSNPELLWPLIKGKILRVSKRPVGRPAKFTQGEPRVLFDVSITREYDHRTGIQRVVKSITGALYKIAPEEAQAVYLDINTLRNADDFAKQEAKRRNSAVALRPGDNLLMLDSNWNEFIRFQTYFDQVRNKGGHVYTVVYDVIPLTEPALFDEFLVEKFTEWFRSAVAQSDGLICISRSVADEAIAQIKHRGLPHRENLKVGFFHLGADIPHSEKEASVRDEVVDVFKGDRPVFLMVGTIEPRKRHEDALTAIEKLWAEGRDITFCIVGKYGWKATELADRLKAHPEKGRRLFWIDDASDAEVQLAYRSSSALLFPTWAEGYGLPVIEAAYFGLPVLCSDLPVLREVGGEHAIYFPRGEPDAIANAVRMFLSGQAQVDPTNIKRLTWEESAQQLLAAIHGQAWHAIL